MDCSLGEALVCGTLPHNLLLGWHFRSIIAYPTGKRSQPIQVSTAPNAERIEADKTTGNMAWRAAASAVKWRQDMPETEFLNRGEGFVRWWLWALGRESLFALKQQNRENSLSLWRHNKTCSWPWKYLCGSKGLVVSRLTHIFKSPQQRCVQNQIELLLEFRSLLLEEKWAHLLQPH